MKKYAFRNKKGVELSINMLVIVALAVFALFLIMGFVIGGFDFFKKLFWGISTQPEDIAKLNCQKDLNSYRNVYEDRQVDSTSDWNALLCGNRYDVDFNGNGKRGQTIEGGVAESTDPELERAYSCVNYVDVSDICP